MAVQNFLFSCFYINDACVCTHVYAHLCGCKSFCELLKEKQGSLHLAEIAVLPLHRRKGELIQTLM